MTRRKIITRGIVCLMLGALTTVAVAWGLALVQPKPALAVIGCWYRSGDTWSKASLSEARHAGLVRRETEWFSAYRVGRLLKMQEPPMRHEAWGLSDAERAQRLAGAGVSRTTEVATGWPMAALWYAADEGSLRPPGSPPPYPSSWPSYSFPAAGGGVSNPAAVLNGARLPDAWRLDGRVAGEPVVLPLSPIWPGLAADTLVFAALWMGAIALWPLTLGRLMGRTMRRLAKGQCPKCGYDLGGSLDAGCPECGWRPGV